MTIRRPRLLVVGGASLDVLHVHGVPTRSAGGAGLYTALAAARCGVDVVMLAPVPDPMPDVLAPARERLTWIGPVVPPDQLPRFEIAYDAAGDITLFEQFLGAESDMTPDLLGLVDDLPHGVPELAFCVPFHDAGLQRSFVDALHRRGCRVAVGTYLAGVRAQAEQIRTTFEDADVSFCNRAESALLHRSLPPRTTAPRLRYVTAGRAGALVVQGDHRTEVPAVAADVVDPTGAGDTFCGTVLAGLALGRHPVDAARLAVREAAAEVGGIGPERLWSQCTETSATVATDRSRRVVVDEEQVDRLADLLVQALSAPDDGRGSDFVDAAPATGTGSFPPVGAPWALDWFAAATLQQFGFWTEADGAYAAPVVAPLGGRHRKGSDYLWAAYRRWAEHDPGAMTVERQATLTSDELAEVLRDDDGVVPLPTFDLMVDLANAYGTTMTEAGWNPHDLVRWANAQGRPTLALLTRLDHIGGYREDPLRKKSALLALVLRQRPEAWLRTVDGDEVPPIVDYHVQRACLRTGMVRVDDPGLHERLVARRLVGADDEDAVRRASAAAVDRLVARSGRSMGAIDWFLFQMRRRCPELERPDCAACPAAPACARRIELFQPVRRTTAY